MNAPDTVPTTIADPSSIPRWAHTPSPDERMPHAPSFPVTNPVAPAPPSSELAAIMAAILGIKSELLSKIDQVNA